MIVQGMSGLMSLTGEPDGPAMRCGTSASDVFTGLYAFGAISAALYDREKTGKGQFIDVAMLDATFSCLENAVINTCVFGTDPQRVGNSHPTSVPFGTFPTSDGEIIITCSRDPAFYSLCRALGREDMVEDPRFSKAEARRQHKAELTEEISRFTRARTLDECERIFEAHGVPNGRINTMKMSNNIADAEAATVEGLGFAVPTGRAVTVINDILATGAFHGIPSIGVYVAEEQQPDGTYRPVIDSVTENFGAEAAGLQRGDVILAADGTAVYSNYDLLRARRAHIVGETITLTVQRDGQTLDVEVYLYPVIEE